MKIESRSLAKARENLFTQRFDRFGFFATFIIGSTGILSMKVNSLDQSIVTVFAMAVMIIYSAIIYFSPRLRLREDQAGDNVYYLGLLFTLVSLAWALWVFTPENGARQVIGSFGVALATTILGLSLRVFFNQMRLDLVEIEREAHIELTEAVNGIRSAIQQVIQDIGYFHLMTQQATAETHIKASELMDTMAENSNERHILMTEQLMALSTKASDDIKAVAAKATDGIDVITKQMSEEFSKSFAKLNERTQRLATVSETIVTSIEKHGAALERLAVGMGTLDSQIGTLAKIAADAEKGLNALTKKTTDLRNAQTTMLEASTAARNFITAQEAALADLQTTLQSFSVGVMRAATRWEVEETKAIERVTARNMVTKTQLEDEMRQLHAGQAEALRRFTDTLQAVSKTVASHSEAMGRELETSRAYTLQVHSSLVEMTSLLVNSLEQRQLPATTLEPPR